MAGVGDVERWRLTMGTLSAGRSLSDPAGAIGSMPFRLAESAMGLDGGRDRRARRVSH
jgi:hypothetical protein